MPDRAVTEGLREQLLRDEAMVEHAYRDSLSFWSIGCGKMIDPRKGGRLPDWVMMQIPQAVKQAFRELPTLPLSMQRHLRARLPLDVCNRMLDEDIREKTAEVYSRFPWVMELDEPRRATIIQMAFQLGTDGLSEFRRSLGYMERGEYTAASLAFADSKVAREQAPKRWARHSAQIKSGEWQ